MKLAIIAILFGLAFSEPAWKKEFTLQDIENTGDGLLPIFNEWSQAFNRKYADVEEASNKYLVWLDNVHKIAEINSKELSYKLGLNQFADMTGDEFRHYVHGDDGACYRNDIPMISTYQKNKEVMNKAIEMEAPASVDWTTKGVVTPVKNQGQCGSCWAFSTTGSLECDYAIEKGTLNSLSEQQLVDCAPFSDGCLGCNGGQMDGAFKYVEKEGGLCSETTYAYTAKNGQCKASTCGTKYNANKAYTDVTPRSSTSLETAVAAGCVSVAIEADQTAFQHYSSGVLTGNCGTNLDHGVLVVGYGTSGSQQYWKVKNSWGATWGDKGYVLICKDCNKNGNQGECGILDQPSFPTF